MINVNIEALTKNNVNKYSLVTAVAKRARVIADQAKIDKEPTYDRPVSTSFDELVDGKYVIDARDPAEVMAEAEAPAAETAAETVAETVAETEEATEPEVETEE